MNSSYSSGPGKSGENSFYIHANMLPDGEAEKLKAGDTVTLRCLAPVDKDNEVKVECCDSSSDSGGGDSDMESPQEDAGEPGEEGQSGDWETAARKELNPQAPENSAM
jgi:hypothetical protein